MEDPLDDHGDGSAQEPGDYSSPGGSPDPGVSVTPRSADPPTVPPRAPGTRRSPSPHGVPPNAPRRAGIRTTAFVGADASLLMGVSAAGTPSPPPARVAPDPGSAVHPIPTGAASRSTSQRPLSGARRLASPRAKLRALVDDVDGGGAPAPRALNPAGFRLGAGAARGLPASHVPSPPRRRPDPHARAAGAPGRRGGGGPRWVPRSRVVRRSSACCPRRLCADGVTR